MSCNLLKDEVKRFKDYLYENRWWLLLFNGLLLLLWSPWMANTAPRIDTEALINTPRYFFNWLDIGRYGAVFTAFLTGQSWFNPLFAILCGYLLICIAGTGMGYLCHRASGKNAAICAAFSLLCFTAPIMAEQFYFELQIFQIAWAYVLCTIAVGSSYAAILWKNKLLYIVSVLCLIWSFSTYQIFVVLYVALAVTCFILLYQRWTLSEGRENVAYFRLIGHLIGIFAAAFIINQIITSLFFSSSGYLEGQIAWYRQTPAQCLLNILTHIKSGFLGETPFFTPLFGVAIIAILVLCIYQGINGSFRRHKLYWLYCVAIVGLQLCPFLLTVYLGASPVPRAQLVYPMVLALDLVILTNLCTFKKLRIIALVFVAAVCWTQAGTTSRLIYTDLIRAQEDARIATELETSILAVSSERKPLAFVGGFQNKLNAACLRGELIGTTVFNINSEIEPHYLVSSSRSCGLSKVLGVPFENCSADQMLEARRQALDMPVWPAQGSIVDAGEFIIVKLSEDDWPEDLIDPTLKAASFDTMPREVNEDEMRVAVDSVRLEDDQLTIQGWAFINNVESSTCKTTVYLKDKETGEYYEGGTGRKHRPDLISAFENGKLYEYGGYVAECLTDSLDKPLDQYVICVGIERDGEVLLTNTGIGLRNN